MEMMIQVKTSNNDVWRFKGEVVDVLKVNKYNQVPSILMYVKWAVKVPTLNKITPYELIHEALKGTFVTRGFYSCGAEVIIPEDKLVW